jgi:hypothetical protein
LAETHRDPTWISTTALTIPATSVVRLLEIHLADLAVARRRSVSTLAAVTRMSVLRLRVTQTVAADVA